MATAPKCKICGKAHWTAQGCALAPAPRAAMARPAAPKAILATDQPPPGFGKPILVDDHLAAENTRLKARVAELEAQLSTKRASDAAYMRDYRARKRAG